MGIQRQHNSMSPDWTQSFGHDLCIQWDSQNPFTCSELMETEQWRYPPAVFLPTLVRQLSKHPVFKDALPPGAQFDLANVFGGPAPLQVFMQMVYKSGWAVRAFQDHIDRLMDYPPIPED